MVALSHLTSTVLLMPVPPQLVITHSEPADRAAFQPTIQFSKFWATERALPKALSPPRPIQCLVQEARPFSSRPRISSCTMAAMYSGFSPYCAPISLA